MIGSPAPRVSVSQRVPKDVARSIRRSTRPLHVIVGSLFVGLFGIVVLFTRDPTALTLAMIFLLAPALLVYGLGRLRATWPSALRPVARSIDRRRQGTRSAW